MYYPMTDHMYGYGHLVGFGIAGLLLMALFWVVVIALIVTAVRRIIFGRGWRHRRWQRWHEMAGNSALNILNERYAKSEINKEEYDQKKKDLTAS